MEEDGEENLAQNMFLRVLRTKFKDIWSKAEEELLFICVPQSGSFGSPASITRDVVESHVMRESRMFVGSFETLSGKTVQVEGSHVSTREGWEEPRECRIKFEELFYNSQWQKFRVVCIDGALTGGLAAGESDIPKMPVLMRRTLNNCRSYLEAFPENDLVLRKIRQNCETFVSSYYVIKGFEHHARDKVQALLRKSIDDLLCTNKVFRQFHYEDRNMDALSQIVESFMFEGLHVKLFGSMCEIQKDQDENIQELGRASRDSLKLSQLGTGAVFNADDLPLAVATLAGLEERKTPLEKLLCFKETIDAINEDLVAHREKTASQDRLRTLSVSQESLVTSDELLPILVYVIVRSGVQHLLASLAYAEYFTFFNVQTSELGFCMTTIKAAAALMVESRLLKKMRREAFPDSKYVEKKGRKAVSARRASATQNAANAAQVDAMKRTISVPGGMSDVMVDPLMMKVTRDSKTIL